MKWILASAIFPVCLIWHGFVLTEAEREKHEYNPFALKRSPYGEIVGSAMQDPVHLISHGGMDHDHMQGGGVDSSKDVWASLLRSVAAFSLQDLKVKLLAMESNVRQNNQPGRRSSTVRLYEGKLVREMMREAYNMDPTNYGSYNIVSYHEKSKDGLQGIERMAQTTLEATEGRNWDPADALTAASAAENLLIYRSKELGFEDKERFAADYDLFATKVAHYEKVFNRAVDDERIYNFKKEKIDEMRMRYKYFSYTLREYGKRVEEATDLQ